MYAIRVSVDAELKIKSGSLKLFVGVARAGHPKEVARVENEFDAFRDETPHFDFSSMHPVFLSGLGATYLSCSRSHLLPY